MVGRRRAVACCAVAAVAAVAAAGAAAGARAYVVGAYVRASARGKKVTFALSADGATIRGFRAAVVATCARRARTRSVSLAALKVATAGTFSTTAAGVTVRGRVDQPGSAAGTVRAVWKAAGASCDNGSRSFSARAL